MPPDDLHFSDDPPLTGAGSIPPPAAALQRIRDIVGPQGWSDDPETVLRHTVDTRELFHGACALLVRPACTEEVAAVVRVCAEHRIAIVPQGGNTGLVGAGVPHRHGNEIVVSLARMNRIRDIDPLDYTLTAEAGCILADVQRAAGEVDRHFPLSLGAEGSCRIGGNLSTNAGGVNVLRYGNARDLVLGLEVVLPDGTVWNGLRRLRKDNTGYDLKHLFIGAEGTLGIITAAVCKLFPKPKDVQTAFVALCDIEAAIELLARARAASGDRVTSFELICRTPLEFAVRHGVGVVNPIDGVYEAYALVEFSGARPDSGMAEALESMLVEGHEAGLVKDAAVAQSEQQRRSFWRIREAVVETQKHEGVSIKHDVSVAVSRVPEFIRRADAAVVEAVPGCRPVAFGHCGDGNVHYNVAQPPGADPDAFLKQWDRISSIVHALIAEMGGSFSAEHGVGQMKRRDMIRYKQPVALDLMRRLKGAVDPHGIMNPGKIL